MSLRVMSAAPTEPDPRGAAARPLTICVFCGARPGRRAADTEAARHLGLLIGRRGHRLLYGGGGSGLMGEVAWSAQRHGAPVTGVIPTFLVEKERGIAAPPQQTVVTSTLGERKVAFLTQADAFVALPGGFGTLDEVLEVISLNQLKVLTKPIVLVNTDGFWARFLGMAQELTDWGFTDPDLGSLCSVTGTTEDALRCVERHANHTAGLAAVDAERL
ncbi:TIGR00730 family Rossman fold protein [Micromonospora sp. NPDC049801]|uniref:LOG family protein n=1 Tax=unclassified Micromonospora TaxID=2617518 RepID=UPI0033C52FB0